VLPVGEPQDPKIKAPTVKKAVAIQITTVASLGNVWPRRLSRKARSHYLPPGGGKPGC
jgi:hypothetical protein